MSRKTVKILTECVMCTILTTIMTIGALVLYAMHNGDDDPLETPAKEQSK